MYNIVVQRNVIPVYIAVWWLHGVKVIREPRVAFSKTKMNKQMKKMKENRNNKNFVLTYLCRWRGKKGAGGGVYA